MKQPLKALDRNPVWTWDYHDQDGNQIGYVARYEDADGKRVVPFFKPDGQDGFKPGIPDLLKGAMTLYGFANAATVYVVEGEKCVEAMRQMGLCAVTSQGGASNAKNTDWTPLSAVQKVILVPDNDSAGASYADEVAGILRQQNSSQEILLLTLPDLPAKGDVVDWVQAQISEWDGYTEDERVSKLADSLCDPESGGGNITPFLLSHHEGAKILDDIHSFLGRFIAYPSDHAQVAHTLWIGHTHLMDCWDSTPRLAALSPEPECGKSRVLEVSEVLVPRPVESVNVTPAYLFRKVADEEGRPTILYDEIDTVFGPKARDNEEIRGLLNAGHRKHAKAGRCFTSGNTVKTEEIPAYCAVALAGIGDLPDTIMGRSVILKMRRRAPNETVEPWRRRVQFQEGDALRKQLASWAKSVEDELTDYWPEMPPGIEDRPADVWEALLAVADKAGGDWLDRAREACVALVAESRESSPSLGVRLLKDLKQIFGDAEHLSTNDILNALYDIEEAPWASLKGKPLDPRGLAFRLRSYDIKPRDVRIGEKVLKGYYADDLWDAWERYLPPSPEKSATSATSATDDDDPDPDDEDLPF
jgi:5S rRNA maturation endonuclease (ribonuclease M5)